MLDSLLRQLDGSEDINITNFGKILLKFAIVLKLFFEYLCPFLCSTIITGQRKFLSLAVGFFDRTPETKNGFKHFHCELRKLFL